MRQLPATTPARPLRPLFFLAIVCFLAGSLQSQGLVRIQNRWKGTFLNNQQRRPDCSNIQDGWWSAMWIIEPQGHSSIRLKNRWTGEYLQVSGNTLSLNTSPGGNNGIWTLEFVDAENVRLKNNSTGQLLHTENNLLELGTIQPGWLSAQWQFKPINAIPDDQKGYSTDRIPERLQTLVSAKPVTNRYNHNRLASTLDPSKHINGVGIFKDESLILAQELGGGKGDLILSDPVSRKLVFKSYAGIRYQSGIQACGNFAAIATNTPENTAEIRFYRKSGSELSPLNHLKKVIPNSKLVENTALVFHQKLNCHFITANSKLYVSNGESLMSNGCRFDEVRIDGSNPMAFGEAGGSLLYEKPSASAPLGALFWVSCGGRESDNNPYIVKLAKIELFIDTQLVAKRDGTVKEYTLKEADKTNVSVIDLGADTRPSFRWGGNVFINRLGDLKAVASERDINIHTWDAAVWSPGTSAASDCGCPAKTFRNVSEHSWVEFRLPKGTASQTISIKSGAYNNYVFPKCNRVYWSNLQFRCNASTCQWEKVSGSWDADALCHGSKGNSPYVFVGNR